jgi:GNAT superfamily N-acetyltransferase
MNLDSLRFIQVEAATLLHDNFVIPLDDDVRKSARSWIGGNLKCLKENIYSPQERNDPNRHLALVALDESCKLGIAYRYFHFEPGTSNCVLFATYVAPAYRLRKIAKALFLRAIEIAREAGCTHFTIPIGLDKPTDEKVGLFEYYKRYQKEMYPALKFTFYTGRMEDL